MDYPIPNEFCFYSTWEIPDIDDDETRDHIRNDLRLYMKLLKHRYDMDEHTFVGTGGYTCGELAMYTIRSRHHGRIGGKEVNTPYQ